MLLPLKVSSALRLVSSGLLLSCSLTPALTGQIVFITPTTSSNAGLQSVYALNANGTIGAGVGGSTGTIAHRWTMGQPLLNLGTLPSYGSQSIPYGLSADGTVVVGLSGIIDFSRAFRWVSTSGAGGTAGVMTDLGVLPGHNSSYANAVSADGTIVVGRSGSNSSNRAFRWTAQTGMVSLGTLNNQGTSSAIGISADGSTITGSSAARAFRWTASTGMQNLGSLPGYPSAQGNKVSRDGSIIVGFSSGFSSSLGSNVARPFRWTASTGLTNLGTLPGLEYAAALGVSGDGRRVVGYATDWNNSFLSRAFLWSEDTGMVDLTNWLTSRGVNLNGRVLTSASVVSDDGTAIGGAPGWIVRGLTWPCTRSDIAGPNQSQGFDSQLSADDIILFLNWYFASDIRADVAGPNQSTMVDGVLTADDIVVFLRRFFDGC